MSKLDLTKPYRTREGGEAKAMKGPDGWLYGWLVDPGWSNPVVQRWMPNGSIPGHGKDHPWDLVNVPETRTATVWLNIGPGNYITVWPNRAEADMMADQNRIACIEQTIRYTVGEGMGDDRG